MTIRRWLITLGACVLLFAGLAAFKYQQIMGFIAFAESFPEPSETVEATRVIKQASASRVTTLGEVVAPQSLELRNELEGRIARLEFKSGGVVKRGQLLLQLDISEEEAQLKAAEARLKLAELDLQRVRKLREGSTISAERKDQAVAQFDVAQADIAVLQATIDKKTLTAPFDAYTGLHQLEVGEFLQANSLITTLIGTTDYFWVDFSLPLSEASTAIGTEITVAPIAHADQAKTGVIVAKDSVISATSRNLRFRASIASDKDLPQNAVVNITVPTSQTTEALTIPATAVRRDQLGDYVFQLVADEKTDNAYRAQRRSVTTASFMNGGDSAIESQWVTVKEGLQEGDLVAANGSFKLRENLLVYVTERAAESPEVSIIQR